MQTTFKWVNLLLLLHLQYVMYNYRLLNFCCDLIDQSTRQRNKVKSSWKLYHYLLVYLRSTGDRVSFSANANIFFLPAFTRIWSNLSFSLFPVLNKQQIKLRRFMELFSSLKLWLKANSSLYLSRFVCLFIFFQVFFFFLFIYVLSDTPSEKKFVWQAATFFLCVCVCAFFFLSLSLCRSYFVYSSDLVGNGIVQLIFDSYISLNHTYMYACMYVCSLGVANC